MCVTSAVTDFYFERTHQLLWAEDSVCLFFSSVLLKRWQHYGYSLTAVLKSNYTQYFSFLLLPVCIILGSCIFTFYSDSI